VLLAGVLGLDGSEQFGVGLLNECVAVVHGSPSKDGTLAWMTRAAQANG
jgi:hypothetical protein